MSNNIPGGKSWENDLDRAEKSGAIMPTISNVRRIFARHPYLHDCFGFSEMESDIMVMRPLPSFENTHPPDEGKSYPRLLTEPHLHHIRDMLCVMTGGTSFKPSDIDSAISNVAFQNSYNPVHVYLESLEWDGERRVSNWLHKALGAANSSVNATIGTMFLVAAVRRITFDQYKFDSMLVLEGPKGIQKSTACRILFGNEYFLEGLPDITRERTTQMLAGKWGVEISEMQAFNRCDAAAQKEFLSTVVDSYKRPYARRPIAVPRTCVYIATTNEHNTYIKEKGFDRRFWPVRCCEVGGTDMEWLTDNRDQLWAEAYHLARDLTVRTYLEKNETGDLTEMQDERVLGDPWEDAINLYAYSGEGRDKKHITPHEILIRAVNIPPDRCDRNSSIRVSRCMANMGWERKKIREGKTTTWVYVRPE